MPDGSDYLPGNPEAENVVVYRRERLVLAGYPPAVADMLAELPDVDLHVATGLLDHGCDPDLAVRILS